MNISRKEYDSMTKKASPPSKKLKNAIFAFVIGGFICTLGEAVSLVCEYYGMSEEDVRLLVPVSLIVLSAILTALGIFDDIALHAGAGTIVPITGFANSIVSPALEFKSEGRILGTGANMFKIAGPVLVYGTLAAVIYGVVYYVFMR
ncbi:MAG: stage V sporulation protein AC [Clostridia bacterium]|nr:stage V sporulation protein AC [Clostridia bacterium]